MHPVSAFDRMSSLSSTLISVGLLHGALLVFDFASGFSPFLRGDRSGSRLSAMQAVLEGGFSRAFSNMLNGDVHPGEYGLQLPWFTIAGAPGVVVFQIALTLIAVYCIWHTVKRTVPWRHAPLCASWAYALTPMNLTFTHQLTTEALATPFGVFFIYYLVRAADTRALKDVLCGGLCLGVVLLIRPGYMVMVPCLIAMGAMFAILRSFSGFKALFIACMVACLALSVWTAAFTVSTGNIGYTNGVANVGWNLRSKVFFVERAAGRPGPPEVARFHDYSELYSAAEAKGKISIPRYLEIASEHPLDYVKAGVLDVGLAFARGGFSKLAVDYAGIARENGIKEWRNILDEGGPGALVSWSLKNVDILAVTAFEMISSLISAGAFSIAAALLVIALLMHKRFAAYAGQPAVMLIIVAAALLATTMFSALVVDRAQPRLRNPADPAILLLVTLALSIFGRLRARGGDQTFGKLWRVMPTNGSADSDWRSCSATSDDQDAQDNDGNPRNPSWA